MLTTGELARLIEEDGVSGVTSNPATKFVKPFDSMMKTLEEKLIAAQG